MPVGAFGLGGLEGFRRAWGVLLAWTWRLLAAPQAGGVGLAAL